MCGITHKNLRWTVCDKRSWAAVLAEADRCHEHRDWREDIDDHCAHVSRRRRWRHMVINVRATRGAVPRDDYICSQIQNQCRAERHCRTGSGASARIRSGIASSFITWNACEELKVRVGHSSVQVAALARDAHGSMLMHSTKRLGGAVRTHETTCNRRPSAATAAVATMWP